ncbi:MAG: DUF3298 domain-containing protein [Oscillospiraceae bacterium]|nr:DUF3298 domain-containing protein [Oscillospiraceae bacterium]
MKRILCTVTVLSLLLFTGCISAPESTPSTTDAVTETTTVPATTDVTPSIPDQKPMVSVSMPVTTEETTAQDGTVVFRHIYQNMELIVPDADIADSVILDYLSRTDTEDAAAALSEQAMDAYSTNSANWVSHLTQTTYAPQRIDNGVLSLFGSHVTFTGGAHADAVYRSFNYDLVTGQLITLNDFLTESITGETLAQLVIESLTAQKDEKNIWDGFESTVTSRFLNTYLQDQDWFFSTRGLCFFFPPYEISPYSSGAVVAEIPYEKLAGLAQDSYFPTELEPAYGELEATYFTDADLSKYTQISEVNLSDAGQRILLHTEYSVHNLRIEQGQWSANGVSFVPQDTIFHALSLTPGDAVMIAKEFTETLPSLRITYENNTGTVQQFLSVNNSTNTLSLTQ